MSWLTLFGYFAMFATLVFLPEISRKLARVVAARRPERRGARLGCTSRLAPRPSFAELVAHGQAARYDDRTIARTKDALR